MFEVTHVFGKLLERHDYNFFCLVRFLDLKVYIFTTKA